MDIKALKKEAKDYRTSPHRLLELARQDTALSRLIALRPNLPLQVMHELSKSRDMPTRANVAKNYTAPMEILEVLARDPQWTVAKAVLGAMVNRTVTPNRSTFEIIAAHKRHTVRQTAADNRFCPPDLLERLAQDPAPEVRRAVAENITATAELLHRLAADPDDRVVWNVAHHPNTTDETLDLLAEHPHPHTRHLSIYRYLSFSRKREIPVERLVKLANDPEREILEDIIGHRNAPTWLVEQVMNQHPELFAIGPELYIRDGMVYGSLSGNPLARAVENHPDLDYTLLERIASIAEGSIFRCLQAHPKFDLNLLERLARAYLEQLAQLLAAPPAPKASAAEQKLHSDLCFKCAYSFARLTLRENLPEHLQSEILEALGRVPVDHHVINQLLESPFPAVREFAQGRKPEW